MKMRWMRTAALAVAMAIAVPAQAQAQAQDKLTVLLDWFVNPYHGPLYVAQELGYFKDEGLAVELIAPADPDAPPRLVAAGQGDIALSYQPQLHLQVEAGLPVVRVGTLIATPLNSLLVLKDGPIKTIRDLKGRKIGFSVSGFEDALLGAMLEKHGLTLKDVTLVNVNFSLSPALFAGQVDAVIGGYRNFELNQMAMEKKEGRAFLPEEEGVPAYDELIFITAKAKQADPRIGRFLNAVERGTQFLINHPDQAWKLFIKGRTDQDTELNRRAWADSIARFAHSPRALDRTRYTRFAQFLKARGLIKTTPDIATYAVEIQ